MSPLAGLADRSQVADLVARLGRWLDAQQFDDGHALRTIYTEDAEVRSPRGTARGIDGILDYAERNSSSAERTQHFASDVLVELDHDTADVTANLIVYFFRDGQTPHRTVGLLYRFTAVRTTPCWRFSRAEISPLWSQGEAAA